MSLYGQQSNLKKKIPYANQKISEKISKQNIKLIHQISNSINISLLVTIFILFFLSLNSQKKWSNIYKTLSKTRAMNNNLIEYISKTEEFYIGELHSLNSSRKTKPKDLIYIDRIAKNKESFFKKNFTRIIEGFSDSKYQRGY